MKRRALLQSAATGAPTLRLLAQTKVAAGANVATPVSEKFTPLDISRFYNASAIDFGPRERIKPISPDGLVHTPGGKRQYRGIPFLLGPEDAKEKRWMLLSTEPKPWTRADVAIPVGRKSRYVCLAQFCDWEPDDYRRDVDVLQMAGERLVEATMVYDDGAESTSPLRYRYETCSPFPRWGRGALLALPHPQMLPQKLSDPLAAGMQWGELQTVVREEAGAPFVWICALSNPSPEKSIKILRFRATGSLLVAICGVTLFEGHDNPLRYERLSVYRVSLPEANAGDLSRWELQADLGVLARTYVLPEFDSDQWLKSPGAALGQRAPAAKGARHLYAEVTASDEATLFLRDRKSGKSYEFDLSRAKEGNETEARTGGARVQLIERDKVWLRATVVDVDTKRPVPVRLAFRSKEGCYIPPYGHRKEINTGWFQDYGADLKALDDSFAYVDGEFDVELPTGEVYLEMSKGFEYAAVRQKLQIDPRQRELKLEIARYADLRSKGWVNADTHVHFLSPSTAILEGQAEGLNLINLLTAQWGDLYTNLGDLAHGPVTSRDGEMVVWPGTENRHHVMGHLGLLGGTGRPVFPLSGGFPYGPDEAYLGDPLWTCMSDWADACRARGGLTVACHFPDPLAELAADIVLGKVDAIEVPPLRLYDENCLEWYRYLNCGYRLPVVGGTDKMRATVAVGERRTYAYLGDDEFSFANWAKAVRKGNTFATSGPLLLLNVDGHAPGGEINLRSGGATLDVHVQATCFTPIHQLEIVVNGKVVASREEKNGAREIALRERAPVSGPGWIAARCRSHPRAANWRAVFAHTSPVYLVTHGRELFSAPVAAYLMTLIDGTQAWVEAIATRASTERHNRIRQVLEEARAKLQQRMDFHKPGRQ